MAFLLSPYPTKPYRQTLKAPTAFLGRPNPDAFSTAPARSPEKLPTGAQDRPGSTIAGCLCLGVRGELGGARGKARRTRGWTPDGARGRLFDGRGACTFPLTGFPKFASLFNRLRLRRKRPGSDLPGVRASCPCPSSGRGTSGLSAGATPAGSSSKTHRFLTVKVTADGTGPITWRRAGQAPRSLTGSERSPPRWRRAGARSGWSGRRRCWRPAATPVPGSGPRGCRPASGRGSRRTA